MKPIERMAGAPSYKEEVMDGFVRITVTPNSAFIRSPKPRTVHLTPKQYEGYLLWRHRGVLIQDALPDLTNDEREVLLTGLKL